MSKLALQAYRSKALSAIQNSRATVKQTVHQAEVIGGAFLGGYADAKMPDGVLGLKPSAAGGLLLVGVGLGMKQADLTHLGLGMLCSFVSDKGAEMAAGSPASPTIVG